MHSVTQGSGWGAHVYLWQIHFDIWQNQYNIVKLNKIKFKKKDDFLYTSNHTGNPCLKNWGDSLPIVL